MIYLIRYISNYLAFLMPPTRFFGLRSLLMRLSGIDVGTNSHICGKLWIYGRGKLRVGEETWISPGAVIHTHLDADIQIGSRCDIGPSVEFITGSHVIGTSQRRAGKGSALPISVGDGCWIGARTVILGGVRIGAGCVVAAGSVVTRDIPANVLAAGVPARIKRVLCN